MNIDIVDQHLTGSQIEKAQEFNREQTKLAVISGGPFLIILARDEAAAQVRALLSGGDVSLAVEPEATEEDLSSQPPAHKAGWPDGPPGPVPISTGPASSEPGGVWNETWDRVVKPS